MSAEALTEIVPIEPPAAAVSQLLAASFLFHNADAAVRERVAQALTAFAYPKGSQILGAGTPHEALGIVLQGRVSITLPGLSGGTQLETLLPGESFAEGSSFPGGTFPFEATALDDTQILWLAASDAETLSQRLPPFGQAVGVRLSAMIEKLSHGAPVATPSLAPGEVPLAPMPNAFDPRAPGAGGPAIPFVELREYDLQPSVLNLVPYRLVRQHRVLPLLLRERRLTVGMVSPRDVAALADLRRAVQGVDLDVVAIGVDDFNSAVVRLRLDEPRGAAQPGKQRPMNAPATNPDAIQWEQAQDDRETGPARASGDEVVRFVNKMVAVALDREASDVHIEPLGPSVRVRFRIQGTLSDWTEPVPPGCTSRAVAARIKILAGMDIAEKRLPQDGRIGFSTGKREIDLRVSTIPASRGEKVALRVLEGAGSTRPLEQIFLEPGSLGAVRRALNRPYGGILVGGPTGSGKTSTLYSMLHERRQSRPDTQVLMVEDPIEYRLQGAVQVQVSQQAGLGFSQILRAAMRQDPDVIVVGEMRDADTAHLALEAAMTGHLLLSSLHASDTRTVLQRLETLGCARPVLAQALSLIIVQRLVRRLCNSCKVVEPPPPALLETLVLRGLVDRNGSTDLPRAGGCDACNGTGKAGRTVVLEALQITDAVRTALAAGKPLEEIERLAYAENALMPFASYGTYLLQQHIIGASEALLTLVD
ncbi:MAG: Flp pilus assembly complex ATPase component TadA [Deltaproteobacteria bacterium]|nr:Flp pilus assembly complex ATPase component TadA [Deltaproteobacteria bacterium]